MLQQNRKRTVTLMVRTTTADGKRRYYKAVFSKTGQVRAHYALVDGKPEHHPEATYSLRYGMPNGDRVWEAVGKDPGFALTAKIQREHLLRGADLGIEPFPQIVSGRRKLEAVDKAEVATSRKRIDATTDEWINEVSTATLERAEELLREWVVEYPAILRSQAQWAPLHRRPEPVSRLDLKPFQAYWGGEAAAERLTGYLKEEHLLVYRNAA